jgi:Ca2+-binding EF-hand superfamily protein
MKLSKSLVAVAVASLFAGGAIANEGGKDKSGSMGPSFDTLDTNRDGRVSQTEASADASLVFTSADQNGDGYLDKKEWKNRDKMQQSSPQPQSQDMPDSTSPSTVPDSTTPPASDVPSTTPQPDTETPRQ